MKIQNSNRLLKREFDLLVGTSLMETMIKNSIKIRIETFPHEYKDIINMLKESCQELYYIELYTRGFETGWNEDDKNIAAVYFENKNDLIKFKLMFNT